MKWKASIALIIFCATSFTGVIPADADEISTTQQIDVFVDASEDNHAVQNFEGSKNTRQFIHNNEYYKVDPFAPYYAVADEPINRSKTEELAPIRPVYTRKQLEATLNDKRYVTEFDNMLGIVVPNSLRSPFDMIGIIKTIPEGKISVNTGFAKSMSLAEFENGPREVLSAAGLDAMNAASTFIHTYSEGQKKIMEETEESSGAGFSMTGIPFTNEKIGVGLNIGGGKGKADARYDQYAYVHIDGIRLYDEDVMYGHWQNLSEMYCVDGKFNQPNARFDINADIPGMTFWEKVDAVAIEDWVLSALFRYDCGLPDEFKGMTSSKKQVEIRLKKERIDVQMLPLEAFFIFAHSDLIPNQEENVQKMIDYAKSGWRNLLEKGLQILVIGYCSEPGTVEYNAILGRERAWYIYNRMADALRKEGATEKQVKDVLRPVSASEDFPMKKTNGENQVVRLALSKLIGDGGQK